MNRAISAPPRRDNVPGPSASAAAKGTAWWAVSAGLHGLAVAGLVVWGGGPQQPPMPAFQVDIVMEQPGAPPGAMAENTVTEPQRPAAEYSAEPSAAETKTAPVDLPADAGPTQKTEEEGDPRVTGPAGKLEPSRAAIVDPMVSPPANERAKPPETGSKAPDSSIVRTMEMATSTLASPPLAPPPLAPSAVALPAVMAMTPPAPRQKPVLPFISIITKSKQIAKPPAEAPTPALIPAAATFRSDLAAHTERNGPLDAASESRPSTGLQPARQARIQGGNGAGIQQAAAGPAARPPEIDGGAGNPAPRYPYLARERGWEGRVVLRVKVDAAGLPGDIAIGQSSGRDMLDRAAMAAVRKWRFRPASRLGRPVAGVVEIPVSFRLRIEK